MLEVYTEREAALAIPSLSSLRLARKLGRLFPKDQGFPFAPFISFRRGRISDRGEMTSHHPQLSKRAIETDTPVMVEVISILISSFLCSDLFRIF